MRCQCQLLNKRFSIYTTVVPFVSRYNISIKFTNIYVLFIFQVSAFKMRREMLTTDGMLVLYAIWESRNEREFRYPRLNLFKCYRFHCHRINLLILEKKNNHWNSIWTLSLSTYLNVMFRLKKPSSRDLRTDFDRL